MQEQQQKQQPLQQQQLPLDGRGYIDAVRGAWREAFEEAAPQPLRADMDKVYRASMDLLAAVSVNYHGTPSVPF